MDTRRILIIFAAILSLGVIGLIAIFLIFNQFGQGGAPTATQQDPEAIYTSAAQTVIAQTTLSAAETAIAQLTQIAQATPTPTATVPPPTPVTPTNTSVPPTPTSPPFTPTPTPIPCNWAQFIDDITVEDGTEFPPNTNFTKIWRLKNIGSCTWTPQYDIVFVGGSQMDGDDVIPLNANVRPGESIDISVDLESPGNQGNFTGNWALRDGSGVIFGLGSQQNQPFWVKIYVKVFNQIIFEFTDDFCDARWYTNVTNDLVCPSPAPDLIAGFVNIATAPKLENGSVDDEPALITYPGQGSGGYIAGRYPSIEISPGYHFKTVIGCIWGVDLVCDVTFQLNYILDGSGQVRTLDSWTQINDGEFERIDVDLTPLAGRDVEFILTVLSNGDSADDFAQWLYPRITR